MRLCREDGAYESGGTLTARWRISRVVPESLQCMEASVMWHTEGKGDEDLHVHHFQRLGEAQLRQIGPGDEQSLQCQLPPTPLSYQGRLVTIRWCIRLRLFMTDGREIVTEQPFYVVAAGAGADDAASVSEKPLTEASAKPLVVASPKALAEEHAVANPPRGAVPSPASAWTGSEKSRSVAEVSSS